MFLMDCGEGAQRQVLAHGIGLNKDTTILITHLHGDHVTGLLGLLQTMGLAQRRRPLRIVGPRKILKWLEATYSLLSIGLTFPVEFTPVRRGLVLQTNEFRVKAAKAVHSIEAYSYVVEEKGRPGIFHPERAKAKGVPEGKLWSRLQKGRSVISGGKKVTSADVTGPPRAGRKVGYSGDTRPTAGLVRFFRGCDLLIFDSTFSKADADKAIERKHSTSAEAAQVAKKAMVRKLALTHFSARYGRVSNLVKEARRIFPNTFAAADGLRVDVPYSDS